MHRLRLSTEAAHDYPHAARSSPVYSGEIALLLDAGDGATGAGLELGSGGRYRDPVTGWTAETHARWLALRSGALLRDWGIGALARLAPGAFGRGPSREPRAELGRCRRPRATAAGLWHDRDVPARPLQGEPR